MDVLILVVGDSYCEGDEEVCIVIGEGGLKIRLKERELLGGRVDGAMACVS